MENHLVEVEGLKKYFPIKEGVFSRTVGYVKAVDDVSFSIKKGEIFGLVGESGCGKTTVGRTLLSLLEPTEGLVKFEQETLYNTETGEKIKKSDLQKLRKEMQIIFQDPYASLDPRMNVGMIVSEGLRKHKLVKSKKEAVDKSKELLELCGLEGGNVHKYPHEFSGGQRQRIGIARALALEPKFLVADEPIAALDVSIQAQVLRLMSNLKDRLGLTYLFISHDLSVIRYFCDRVAVMYLGSFVEKASTKKLYHNPLHPYTKSLLSAAPKSDPAVKKKRKVIKGDVPSPADPPEGCKFHTRCTYAEEHCKKERPVLREVQPEHYVSCHFVEKINSL